MKHKILGILISAVCVLCATVLSACSFLNGILDGLGGHTHKYDTAWQSDDYYHWHECLDSGCKNREGAKEAHLDNNGDGACDMCGRAADISHFHSYEWVDNGDGTHKQHCSESGCNQPDIGVGNHSYDSNGVCKCGAEKPVEAHVHSYNWVDNGDGTHVRHCSVGGCDLPDIDIDYHVMLGGRCSVCGAIDWEYEALNLSELANGAYGYEYLGTMAKGSARQSLYKAIDEEVKAVHNDLSANYEANIEFARVNFSSLNLTKEEAVAVWKTYIDDNPLYYWFSNQIGYTETYLALYVDGDYLNGSVRAECNEIIYGKIKEYLSCVQSETSAYQVALAFHDKIINAIDYAYDSKGNPETAKWAHSVMGVFEEVGGVCESYAKAFQLLLNMRGIDNIFVTGQGVSNGRGEAHAWNMIKLDDGQWYWCDLTWDDSPEYMWGIYYGYFCVNDWQGVSWADGGNQYGTETGLGIGGSPSDGKNFMQTHIPYSSAGTGISFLYGLPERSADIYAGVEGELRVRDTFEAGDYKYAVAGYGTVQVTEVPAEGAVVIPESVQYLGVSYTVISIGAVGGTGLFGAGYIIGEGATSVTIPSTVILIWSLSFYNCPFGEIYFNGTEEQWNSIIKLALWKRSGKSFTVHCAGNDILC